MKSDSTLTLVAVAGLAAAAFLYLQRRRTASTAAASNGPAAGRSFFTSPAVASGVQSGQGMAQAAGALFRTALSGIGLVNNGTASTAPVYDPSAPTAGDFARLDRASYSDGTAVNLPANQDSYGGMPADLQDYNW